MQSFFSSKDYDGTLKSFIQYKKQFEKYLKNEWQTSKYNLDSWGIIIVN